MDVRGVLLVGAMFGAGALAFGTACNGPDPGAITFVERPSAGPGEPQSGSSGTSGAPTDGGGTPDAGDPVFGNKAFAYVDPGVAANGANAQHAGTVEGKDCLVAGCHLDGAKPWVFGGTLYTTKDGTTTVPRAEIKIVAPNGSEIGTTYTDANGNFWLDKPGTTIPQGAMVGVRKEGGKPQRMLTALAPTDGACSKAGTCHGGAQGRVYTD